MLDKASRNIDGVYPAVIPNAAGKQPSVQARSCANICHALTRFDIANSENFHSRRIDFAAFNLEPFDKIINIQIGVEESVTVNLGLPFLRTSVDHGTAFDIAGKGIAGETSMIEALKLGASLAARKGLQV